MQPVVVTLTALEDGNAKNGRNVLTFSTIYDYDHDDDPTTDDRTITSGRLTITEDDNDDLGVTVSERALTVREGDTTGETYTVVLGSMPTHDVTVTVAVTSAVNAKITALPSPLTFTTINWNMKQTVTVTAATDSNTLSGSATIKHTTSSDDVDYNKISVASVSVKEVDSVRTVALSISADTVDEGKMVTITATLGNDGDVDTPATLSSPVTVTLTRKATSTAEKSGDFKVSKITIAANSTAGSSVLEALHDADEDDEMLTLTASVDGPAIFVNPRQEVSVEIMDDDTYTLTPDKMEVAEGEEVTLTVKVAPAAALETKVKIDLYRASGATVEPAEGQDADEEYAIIDKGETSAKFTLTTAKDANDATDEVIAARAMVGSAVVGDPVEIMVLDAQATPEFTLSLDPSSIGEADGEASVMLMVMTNKAVTKDTTLTMAVDMASTAMDPDDYSIMPETITVMIEKDMKSGMATLMVTPVMDSMDESNETIVLTAWLDDAQVGNAATLTIIDGDSAGSGITPKSSAEVEMVFTEAIEMAGGLMVGGNSVSVDMGMLFDWPTGTEVDFTVSSSDDSVLGISTSDSTLMLDPMMEGMTTVSVMAQPAGMSSARGAVAAFSCTGACVSVNLEVAGAVTFTLSGPDDMNIAEGMSAMVMVMASSAVAADTEVMLMRDGTSTAGMDDYTVEPMMATIMAGEMMAEFEVMATADDMMEDMEMLTLFLVVDDMQMADMSVSFYISDMLPVPAPPGHRAAPAGGLPGHRRVPPVPAAVTFGGGVRNSPLPPLPRRPGGEGAFFFCGGEIVPPASRQRQPAPQFRHRPAAGIIAAQHFL